MASKLKLRVGEKKEDAMRPGIRRIARDICGQLLRIAGETASLSAKQARPLAGQRCCAAPLSQGLDHDQTKRLVGHTLKQKNLLKTIEQGTAFRQPCAMPELAKHRKAARSEDSNDVWIKSRNRPRGIT